MFYIIQWFYCPYILILCFKKNLQVQVGGGRDPQTTLNSVAIQEASTHFTTLQSDIVLTILTGTIQWDSQSNGISDT